MKPAEWIRKHKAVWQRWPSFREVLFQYPSVSEKQLRTTWERVTGNE